jgi:hypothetical protein
MHIALADLALERLYVVYPGRRRYALADRIEAVPLRALLPDDASSPSQAPATQALVTRRPRVADRGRTLQSSGAAVQRTGTAKR